MIAGVDVNVVTAINEPFGRTLIEAMLLKTPVVATRHGGNIEAIIDGESGFLVDPYLPEAFVLPLTRLFREQRTKQHIVDNAKQFADGLSTEAHVKQVTDIYTELCPPSRNASRRQTYAKGQ
jgi:glycosyltransferase involved in cell wall biosynthesis